MEDRTTVAEASRTYDLAPSEIEEWVEDGREGMENALRTKPLDVKEHYEKQIRELKAADGEAILQMRSLKKVSKPAWGRRQMINLTRQAAAEEGATATGGCLNFCFQGSDRLVHATVVGKPVSL